MNVAPTIELAESVERTAKAPFAPVIGSAAWIRFDELTPNPSTKRWSVMTKDGTQIGMVKWYGPWRKYCFFPMAETVYEQVCLRDIARFCEEESIKHRKLKTPNDPSSATAAEKRSD
mgnify:CR=1 FL=1